MSNPQFEAFTRLIDSVLSISKEELLEREAEYKHESEQNPRKRGPKPKRKVKPSASAPGEAAH